MPHARVGYNLRADPRGPIRVSRHVTIIADGPLQPTATASKRCQPAFPNRVKAHQLRIKKHRGRSLRRAHGNGDTFERSAVLHLVAAGKKQPEVHVIPFDFLHGLFVWLSGFWVGRFLGKSGSGNGCGGCEDDADIHKRRENERGADFLARRKRL